MNNDVCLNGSPGSLTPSGQDGDMSLCLLGVSYKATTRENKTIGDWKSRLCHFFSFVIMLCFTFRKLLASISISCRVCRNKSNMCSGLKRLITTTLDQIAQVIFRTLWDADGQNSNNTLVVLDVCWRRWSSSVTKTHLLYLWAKYLRKFPFLLWTLMYNCRLDG